MKKFAEWLENRLDEKELTTKARKKLKTGSFAIPEKRAYPIQDRAHGQNALARVDQHGTPEEKARVRRAVCKKYPDFETCNGKKED